LKRRSLFKVICRYMPTFEVYCAALVMSAKLAL
jgi:hypothetical protein